MDSAYRVKKSDWFKYRSNALEWLIPHMEPGYDWRKYAEDLLDTAVACKVDTLTWGVQNGGYATWKSDFVLPDEHLRGFDMFGYLVEEGHKRGLKIGASWLGVSFASVPGIDHPIWMSRKWGEDVDALKDWKSDNALRFCMNSPFVLFMMREIREVVTKYPVDSVYIEGFSGVDCACRHCREKFQRLYGYALSEDAETRLADPNYTRFRGDSITNIVRKARNTLDTYSPETVFSWCLYDDNDAEAIAPYVDVLVLELQEGYINGPIYGLWLDPRRPCYMCSLMQGLGANNVATYGTTWHHKHVERDYSTRADPHLRLCYLSILSAGSSPQVHTQNVLQVNPGSHKTAGELFGLMKKVRPFMLDTERMAYVGIVWPGTPDISHDLSREKQFRGLYQVLVESHIPFRIVRRSDLETGDLSDFKVLLMPNVERISGAAVAGVYRFAENGGGLIMTYRTGFCNEEGRLRSKPAFADLAGVKGPFGAITNPAIGGLSYHYQMNPWHYWRMSEEHPISAGLTDTLFSFEGLILEFEPLTGTQVIAHAIDFDYGLMHNDHHVIGGYPKNDQPTVPLIFARDSGHRVVYVPGDVDQWLAAVGGDPETFVYFANAVRWAGQAPVPLKVTAPPSVEVTVHQRKGQGPTTVFVVNYSVTPTGRRVRYVVPVHDVEIEIPVTGKSVKATSLTGRPLAVEVRKERLTIRIPKLEEYEIIAIIAL